MILDIIGNELLKAKTRVEDSTLPPRFKPSSLGTPCLRKLYYDYHRVPKDFDETNKLFRYAHLGDAIGDKISEMLRRSGVLIDYYNKDGSDNIRFGEINKEFPIKDVDLEISAMIDGVMIIDGKLWLGEWKSAGLKAFSGLIMPKEAHLIQGTTYIPIFNKALKDGVFAHIKELDNFTQAEGIIFIYENRDNGHHKEFIIRDSGSVFAKTIEKMLIIKRHTKEGTCPPKTPDWCRSCAFRTKCAANFKIN